MITEIIVFSIPDGMTREEVVANYRRSAPAWRANPDLIRKNYLYDAESRRAGGVYLWRNMDATRRGSKGSDATTAANPSCSISKRRSSQTMPLARRSTRAAITSRRSADGPETRSTAMADQPMTKPK